MPTLTDAPLARVEHDPTSKALRSWFGAVEGAPDKALVRPRDIGHALLAENAARFKWSAKLDDLRHTTVIDGVRAHSARWHQIVDDVAVDASDVVVNMYADGTVHSVYNDYHYDIPDGIVPEKIAVTAAAARARAVRALGASEPADPELPSLLIYRYRHVVSHAPKRSANGSTPSPVPAAARAAVAADGAKPREGEHYLVWDVRVVTRAPLGNWRVLVDARTGQILDIIDLAQYATGTGRVFDPNPVVTSGNAALGAGTPAATLDTMTSPVALNHLNGPDGGGQLHLDGSYVHMQELEAPTFAEPTSAPGDFTFSVGNRSFLDVMAYFHIDRFQQYVQSTLGLTNVANFSIAVDPQGLSGADNSHYLPGSKVLAFGEGGVPDASDAMVILHEYGHAIQDNAVPGFGSPGSGMGEGFGDFLAAVFYDIMHTNPAATRGWMMSWDAQTGWPGRRYDVTYNFDDPKYTGEGDPHHTGELWCTTMFELYRKLGGDSHSFPQVRTAARDLAIRLHLMANFNVPAGGTVTAAQMGQQVEAADAALGGWSGLANGLHRKVIYDTFSRRHLSGYPAMAVDVYVDDGRDGGYGSTSGKDLFGEVLWMDNYWVTQDIWVRPAPYASAAAQQAGGPADHVEPAVGSPAYLYTRVKNRGTSAAGSGPVKVRAFNADPGIGLAWPDDWTEMDAAAAVPVSNVLPGAANGIVAGPFKWTPTVVAHECVFVVLENAADRAVTQDLAVTDHVLHRDLVPFDNNVAQRNLVPTDAKAKMSRGFWLRNPDEVVRYVQLHVTSTLPKGWIWSLGRVNTESIRLAPLDRVWIDLKIDPSGGEEVRDFDTPMELSVTGTIDGRLIGGMTFYAAPETAFAKPDERVTTPGVETSWQRCGLDGELELKIRFHGKP